MRRSRIGGIGAGCGLAVLLVLMTAAPMMAQSEDKREATRAARQAAKEKQTPGWLILDGELIPGPYEVIIEDSAIIVNGIKVVSPPEPKAKRVVDSNIVTQFNLTRDLREKFYAWYVEDGIDSAQQRALNFMQRQPIVERAYFTPTHTLRVLFRGEKTEEGIRLSPQRLGEALQAKDERPSDNLKVYGERLKMHLTSGSLVIMQDGRYRAILHPRSKTVLEKLQEIARTIPDLKERIIAVQNVVHRRQLAEQIAKHFMQK